ncbi:MAG TPA: TIGR02466 family protein [Methylomirabilota bacterium]|nr:TIGR02466 family protein [Methylomirabilota bacterium]
MTPDERGRDPVGLESLFVTPLVRIEWPDAEPLNRHLAELIQAEARQGEDGGYRYSNVGGWHSRVGYEAHPDEGMQLLMARFRGIARQVTARLAGGDAGEDAYACELSAWANVNHAGDYNLPHNHHCTWAGVYYVQVPAAPGADRRAGALELLDPRPAATMSPTPGVDHRCFVSPRPGLMLLFPGWVMHMVHPFTGAGERISIACNALFPGLRA